MASFFSKFDSDRIVAGDRGRGEADPRARSASTSPAAFPRTSRSAPLRRFDLLGMTKTAERNGVLIYIAPRARQFRILGDAAIHEKCGAEFWTEVAAAMEAHFRKGEFTEGVVAGVERVGRGARAGTSPRQHGRPERAPERDRRRSEDNDRLSP